VKCTTGVTCAITLPSFLILRGVTVSFAFSARLHDFRVRQILSCAADELSVPLENFPMLLRICVNAGHVGALFFSMFCGCRFRFSFCAFRTWVAFLVLHFFAFASVHILQELMYPLRARWG
jgi:hypothetical protein